MTHHRFFAASGSIGRAMRKIPYPPIFSRRPARITEPAVRAAPDPDEEEHRDEDELPEDEEEEEVEGHEHARDRPLHQEEEREELLRAVVFVPAETDREGCQERREQDEREREPVEAQDV